MSAAAFRVWRVVGQDLIFEQARERIAQLSTYAADFLECPWCLGFWTALAWWGAYELWPHGTLIAAAPFAISALVGAFAHATSDD